MNSNSSRKDIIQSFSLRQQYLTIVGFSMFFGWLLAVPFQGQVLQSILNLKELEFMYFHELPIITHLLGLLASVFIIKSQMAAKITMMISSIVCILGSIVFYLTFSNLWYIALGSISFFAGLFVASWVMFYKTYSKDSDRIKIAIDVLILSNLFMLIFDLIAVLVSPNLALFVTIAFLLGSLLLTMRLDAQYEVLNQEIAYEKGSFSVAFLTLSLFIFVVTIGSGFMYQVINPAYSDFPGVVAFYWAIPYILILLLIRKYKERVSIYSYLYFAIAMKGFAFLIFSNLSISISSYFLVNSFLMAALGIFDMFLWVALSNFIVRHNEPVKIWAYGLSVNLLGILIGGISGNIISANDQFVDISSIAIVSVFILVIILPFLLSSFNKLEKIDKIQSTENNFKIMNFDNVKDRFKLTEREIEVISLVVKGYTYRAIAEELNITDNTVKFHSKNIYSKIGVNSKMKLIEELEKF